MEWHIIGILAFVVIYNLYRYYHEDDSYEYSPVVTDTSDNHQITETNMEETISTRQLAFQIPGIEDYLKLMLDSLFRTARTLDVEIEKFRLQECER